MSTVFLKKESGQVSKPDVKVDYPWHEIESKFFNQKLDVKKYYPYHIHNGLREYTEQTTLRDVMLTVLNNMYEVMPDIAVELRSEDDVYCTITNENGVAYFPNIANAIYMVTLAKKDFNMQSFPNIDFSENTQMSLQYVLTEQNIRDGWYSNTDPIFYLDTLDGGYA